MSKNVKVLWFSSRGFLWWAQNSFSSCFKIEGMDVFLVLHWYPGFRNSRYPSIRFHDSISIWRLRYPDALISGFNASISGFLCSNAQTFMLRYPDFYAPMSRFLCSDVPILCFNIRIFMLQFPGHSISGFSMSVYQVWLDYRTLEVGVPLLLPGRA